MAAPRSALQRWRRSLARVLRKHVLGRIDRRRVIYRRAPGPAGTTPPFAVQRYPKMDEMPTELLAASARAGTPRDWFGDRFAEGAVLWVAVIDGKPACLLWAIEAPVLGRWYVPLDPHDKVIYAVMTQRHARGGGIAPLLVQAVCAQEYTAGRAIYLDCMAWNRPARRAFEKAGFVALAVIPAGKAARQTLKTGA